MSAQHHRHDHRRHHNSGKPGIPMLPVPPLLLLLGLLLSAPAAISSELTRAVVAGDSTSVARLLSGEDVRDMLRETDEAGLRPIHLAIVHGQRALLAPLVGAGADVEAKDRHGRRPLHLAAGLGDTTVTRWLLERGADVEAQDETGAGALHHAASRGQLGPIDVLLQWAPPVDAVDDGGRTTLAVAVLHAQHDAAARLLRAGAAPNLRDGEGLAPLHHAAIMGDRTLMDMLLAGYAELDARIHERAPIAALRGGTPLHAAVWAEQIELIDPLIDAGADTRLTTEAGDTPLTLAIRQRSDALVARLLRAEAVVDNPGAPFTPLSLALDQREGALVHRLIDEGVDPTSSLPDGTSPLLWAVSHAEPGLLAILLERGADPDQGGTGPRPLRAAIEARNTHLAAALLTGGADPNRPDTLSTLLGLREGPALTPLEQAVEAGHLGLTRTLLEHGAAVDLPRPDDHPSLVRRAIDAVSLPVLRLLVAQGAALDAGDPLGDLDAAMKHGYPFLRELLAANGFSPPMVDEDERTALHIASRHDDDPRLITALLAVDVPLGAPDRNGRTALHEAARRGRTEQTRALLAAGADPALRDHDGKSALDLAKGGAKALLISR